MISIFYIAYLVCASSYSMPQQSLNPNDESLISYNTGQSSCKKKKCSSNAECTKNGKAGYCLNHPQLKTVLNCQGRCIKKIAAGGSCSDKKLNLVVEAINPFAAEHAACESGKCWRGVCTTIINGKNLMGNGGPCGGEAECHSGWCEGSATLVAAGNGVCRAKRKNGESAWKDWQASCVSGKSQCGTCTANYEDLANGKSCSGAKQCQSNWCEGDGGVGCWGKCQAKRANGQGAWRNAVGAWRESCQSGKEQCGTCTSGSSDLGAGAACSKSNNCASNYCGCSGFWCTTFNCGGKCTLKPKNESLISVNAEQPNGEQYCESGQLSKTQCGESTCCHWNTEEEGDASNYGAGRCWSSIGTNTCMHRPGANGESCSAKEQCQSNWCQGHGGFGSWGICQAKIATGLKAWRNALGAWPGSCQSGKEQCGTCTSGSKDLPAGAACSKNNNCASNYCGCSGWFCTTFDCRGKCT